MHRPNKKCSPKKILNHVAIRIKNFGFCISSFPNRFC
uniref:Uncharacterized protein n=1 Tax=Rhizophora mucronata TaxID=61149 RepID=A0A2P2QV07_RHIMU